MNGPKVASGQIYGGKRLCTFTCNLQLSYHIDGYFDHICCELNFVITKSSSVLKIFDPFPL